MVYASLKKEAGVGERRLGWRDKWAFWRAARGAPATGFAPGEPRSIGLYVRGKQMVAGTFTAGTATIEGAGRVIWDLPFPDPQARAEVHGFGWLDDLAAFGDLRAQERAQGWTADWIARFGQGQGPGWTPELIGRRLIRWVFQAPMLTEGRDPAPLLASLGLQVHLLAEEAARAAPMARFEALSGLVLAVLGTRGLEARLDPALRQLASLCESEIDMGGGIASRNPEDLLDLFTWLTWVAQGLGEAEAKLPPEIAAALERMAPTLRALRHADGGLARFHDGGRGAEGRLDAALANAGVKPVANLFLAMGFARLHGGRTSLILDAAPPPPGPVGHASTCGFELTSGRRPVIVNVGAGSPFGAEWRQAGRATASHSTLAIEGYSSSRLGPSGQGDFTERAEVTTLRLLPGEMGAGLHLVHDGWSQTHGLSHLRDLVLSHDGRSLKGIDRLSTLTSADRRRFERLAQNRRFDGVKFAIRFHLHPDVEARLDLGGTAISLTLRSGEIWVFRQDGSTRMTLEPSIYLEKTRQRPRESQQIVLSGAAYDFDTQAGWTLAKAQDTPLAIRDLEREDPTAQI
jgi:uncharacterized heparinase superfamily protein